MGTAVMPRRKARGTLAALRCFGNVGGLGCIVLDEASAFGRANAAIPTPIGHGPLTDVVAVATAQVNSSELCSSFLPAPPSAPHPRSPHGAWVQHEQTPGEGESGRGGEGERRRMGENETGEEEEEEKEEDEEEEVVEEEEEETP